jgi:hypothetical protein
MLTPHARHGLILAGLLASALSAGFFYTYSISVMPGLAAADPSSTIRAMQLCTQAKFALSESERKVRPQPTSP